MNKINHLIISSTIDYSTDLICSELENRNEKYLRLNRDSFRNYDIVLDLNSSFLKVKTSVTEYLLENSGLKSIYFRAPVFLRTINKLYTIEEQLYLTQWNAFIRNLIVLKPNIWINNPVSTYRAENKLYQLQIAKELNMKTPMTIVANCTPKNLKAKSLYIIKSIDTALFSYGGNEMFTYSTVMSGEEIKSSNINDAPIVIQEYIYPKIDIRATYVNGEIYPVKILYNNEGIKGDWRKKDKEKLQYISITLPEKIKNSITKLMKKLELNYGGIDLIFSEGSYYFIEANPTGEWGWLATTGNLPIDKSIVELMIGE